MALIYVRSTDGDDADDGSTWALAKATLVGAIAIAAAGDTIYVSHQHSETTAANLALTSPGTAASPCNILCVNDGAAPPTALATTAIVACTGTANDAKFQGYAYYYGISFTAAVGLMEFGIANSSNFWHRMEKCKFRPAGGGYTTISVGASYRPLDWLLELIDCEWDCERVAGLVQQSQGELRWKGGTVTGTAPTVFYEGRNDYDSSVAIFEGVDFSLVTGTLISLSRAKNKIIHLRNCRLGTNVTVFNSPVAQGGGYGEMVNCASANTNYRYRKQSYLGVITEETTNVRTGGATDGTTGISRKIVSSANSKFSCPLELDCNVQWNETTGSAKTATVHILTDNVTLKDSECWLEVEYLGNANYPLSSFLGDSAAGILAAGSNQAASAETWTETDITTPVKQKLEVTFTPAMKGPIKCRVMLARASTTVYVCPKVVIS